MKLAIAALLILVTCVGAAATPPAKVGEPAPPFIGIDVDGERASLADHTPGRPVLLVFCGAGAFGKCNEMLPGVEALAGRYAADGLVVLGVSTDPSYPQDGAPGQGRRQVRLSAPDAVPGYRRFLEGKKLLPKYRLIVDLDHQILRSYGVTAIPLFALVDAKGAVGAMHAGWSPEIAEKIEADIRAVLVK